MIGEKFNSKAVEFMDKHPKATKLFVSGCAASTMFMPVVASAEGGVESGTSTGVDVDSIIDTLVGSAKTAYEGSINKVVPVIATVIGFNVCVRLVRRFIKG